MSQVTASFAEIFNAPGAVNEYARCRGALIGSVSFLFQLRDPSALYLDGRSFRLFALFNFILHYFC